MNTKEVLQAAYDLIGDKRRWCQGELARDCNGNGVLPTSQEAVVWCAMGALLKIGGCRRAEVLLANACFDSHNTNDVCVNDNLGYAAIRRMFRKAIKEAS